jgi:high affinity cGMP-specific 3',5'-cyclic phosphodiesterase 9
MEIARLAEHEVVNVMECEQCTLFFIDDLQDEIWAPPTEALPSGICIGVNEGLAGHAVRTARSSEDGDAFVLTVNDPPSCPYWKGDVKEGFVTRNLMTTPVWASGKNRRLLGLIQVLNKRLCATGNGGGGKDGLGGLLPLRRCTSVKEGDGTGFSSVDEKLLQSLAQCIGDQLQRLMMDMMFTKARMDSSAPGRDSGAAAMDSTFVSEYYIGNQAANGTVFRGTECVAMALNVLDPAARVTLLRGSSSPSSPAQQLPSMVSLPEISEDVQGQGPLESWRLDYWSMSLEDAFSMMVNMLQRSRVLPELDIEMGSLYNYFKVAKCYYRNNAYHSFAHALMTVHYSYRYMVVTSLSENLVKSDIMALIVGALVHDIDHRGRNNAFESMTRSELAIRYNDSSPLENHHCAQAFQIALSRGECNIFKNLDAQTFCVLRQRMVAGILSTDMKFRGDHVRLLQAFNLQPGTDNSQAQFLVELLLHAADISGPCMPKDISLRWVKAIHTEFTLQVEDEKRLGLPVTKFMDGMRDPVTAAKSQVGFLDFVMHPLFDPLWAGFPGLQESKALFDENKRNIVDTAEGRGSPAVDLSAC